jgi:hypothetical protein
VARRATFHGRHFHPRQHFGLVNARVTRLALHALHGKMLLVGEENFAHRSHNRYYVIRFRMTVAAGTRQLFLMARIAVVMAGRK